MLFDEYQGRRTGTESDRREEVNRFKRLGGPESSSKRRDFLRKDLEDPPRYPKTRVGPRRTRVVSRTVSSTSHLQTACLPLVQEN